jgi:hypothetical protein
MDWINLLKADATIWSDEAKILYPQDEGFGTVTERFSQLAAPKFAASVTAGSEADVSTAVSVLRHQFTMAPDDNKRSLTGQVRHEEQCPVVRGEWETWLYRVYGNLPERAAARPESTEHTGR